MYSSLGERSSYYEEAVYLLNSTVNSMCINFAYYIPRLLLSSRLFSMAQHFNFIVHRDITPQQLIICIAKNFCIMHNASYCTPGYFLRRSNSVLSCTATITPQPLVFSITQLFILLCIAVYPSMCSSVNVRVPLHRSPCACSPAFQLRFCFVADTTLSTAKVVGTNHDDGRGCYMSENSVFQFRTKALSVPIVHQQPLNLKPKTVACDEQ
ncbi:hypothetical protein T01_14404 [Trichinella spiralis]|uniref:Uncharacterized protein n=1 Tax=Trichinella spiralis TaxID=6334 RepID=A0A0V1BFX7_TRISP|nr:hypothetical protein T01_14404 [Trichinella spiralis]